MPPFLSRLMTTGVALAWMLAGPVGAAQELDPVQKTRLNDLLLLLVTKHGFDRDQVTTLLREIPLDQRVLQLMETPSAAAPALPSWQEYRSIHVTPLRVAAGRRFLQQHRPTLARAELIYGVPASIITAILGIETNYGSYLGNFNTLRSLYTLAVAHPTRSQEFRDHLLGLFLLSRQQGKDIRSYSGSYAGAVGLPQFMPSSWIAYAVDFNKDGRIDLISSYEDAIGSVAAYLKSFGWVPREPIALQIASLDPSRATPFTSGTRGLLPSLSTSQLESLGVTLRNRSLPPLPATLVALPSPGLSTEYWLAYKNFYVITRYNQSSFYAMSVFQLAQAIAE